MGRSRGLVLYAICLVVWTWMAHPTLAQDQKTRPDAAPVAEDTLQEGQKDLIDTDTTAKSLIPRKAALFSAVLPGLGQIYNGKYWKLPIIYGGFATLGYFVLLRDDQYHLFLRAKIAIQNNAPEENPLQGIRSGDRIEIVDNNVQSTRRYRDLTIILIAGLYGLQIMDAIVDAHLIEFDVNKDLSLRLHPSAGGGDAAFLTVPNFGISLTLNIK